MPDSFIGCCQLPLAGDRNSFCCLFLQVLGVLEQHKAASAAKFAQLQNVLQDLHTPFLQLQQL